MRTGVNIPRRFTRPIATKEELMSIHTAAMFLLEKIGVGGVTPKLQQVYKNLGCNIVDEKKGVVKIPQNLAMEGINAIPAEQILPGRTPQNDILFNAGSGRVFAGGFGIMALYAKLNPATHQFDFRDCVDADNWREQKIVEYFPEYDMVSPIFLPMDLAEAGLPVDTHDLNSTIQCCSKHIWHIDAIDHVECYTDLAAEVLGGVEELQKRPFITNHGDTPGIVFGQKTSDRMTETLEGWAKGRPLLIDHTDVCIPGFQGPCTITGAYAVTVAASASMATALALGQGGVGKGYIPDMTYDLVMPMDPYTQILAACEEQFSKALALHVNFWHNNYSTPKATMWPGCTIGGSAAAADTQTGMLTYHIFNAFQSATDQCGCWCTTAGPNGIWPDGYAIMAELLKILSYYHRDLDFSPASYMQPEWLNKTPRGDFMKDKYTLQHMVDTGFYPMRHGYGLFELRQYLRWIEDKLGINDRANALVNKIVKEFPAPLPPKDVADRMNSIIAKYDKMYQIGGGFTVDKKGTGARF